MPRLLLIIIAVFTSCQSFAQLGGGTIANLNLSDRYENGWKWNTKIEARIRLFDLSAFERSDLEFIASKKTLSSLNPGAGFLLRYQTDRILFRSIQQLSFTQNFTYLTLNHRLRSDQSFVENLNPLYRYRYRLTAQKTLNGLKLDDKEFYIKGALEIINSWQYGTVDIETRQLLFLGYQVSNKLKLEAGLDNRIAGHISSTEDDLWLSLGMYYNF